MNEYYSPNIDELHIGYEGFLLGQKVVIETIHDFEHWILNPIVTKYLTKEQIGAEGWKPNLITDELIVIENNYCFFSITQKQEERQFKEDPEYMYNLSVFYTPLPYIEIDFWNLGVLKTIRSSYRMYEGECKSINELRTLMKWLKI